MGLNTCAIAPYSITTLTAFRPNTVHMAILVERPSNKEINTGPSNLQNKSILLIEEFKSADMLILFQSMQ